MPLAMVVDTAFRSEERFTQQEFFEWLQRRPASDVNHYELVHGRIVMSPPAGWPHGSLAVRISSRLFATAEACGLGVVQDSSAGYDLPSGDTLEPDVSFISKARFAAGPAPVRGRFLGIVPDLAVEILSKSTARRDRGEKKAIYEECGVGEYWIVDPERCCVTVYRLDGGRYGAGERLRAGPIASQALPQLELTVEELFAIDVLTGFAGHEG
jgi:Uma2 family endonuclease